MMEEGVVELDALQLRVLGMVARGWDVRDIAAELCYTRAWIYAILGRVRESMGVGNDAGAVVLGIALGLLEMPGAGEVRRSDE